MNGALQARKHLQKLSKKHGSLVTLMWLENPAGAITTPAGEMICVYNSAAMYDDDVCYDGNHPAQKTCTVQAIVHYIAPSTSSYKAFAEVQSGDAILDLAVPLYRVTGAGDTALQRNAVVSLFDLNAANRALSSGDDKATGVEINLSDLTIPSVVIDGVVWVQKSVGQTLSKSWDARVSGVNICQSFLLTRGA